MTGPWRAQFLIRYLPIHTALSYLKYFWLFLRLGIIYHRPPSNWLCSRVWPWTSYPPISTFPNTGIVDVYHHAQFIRIGNGTHGPTHAQQLFTRIYPQLKFQELKLKDSRRFPSLQTNMQSGTCVSAWVKTETDCSSHCPVPMCSLAVYWDPSACVPLLRLRAWWGAKVWMRWFCRAGGNRQFSWFECGPNICAPKRPALLVAQSWDFSLLCWNIFFFILAENISFLGPIFFLWFLSWGRFLSLLIVVLLTSLVGSLWVVDWEEIDLTEV